MIPEKLAGKKILVTGVTGFIGQAVVERLLHDCPDAEPSVLIRASYGSTATQRMAEMLKRDSFQRLHAREGDPTLQRLLAEKIRVVEGDFTGELDLPDDLDVVLHCGATVAFDPPIDEGFRTNLLGSQNLYQAVLDSGSRPHIIHTSTAYVAGMRKGVIPEGPLDHKIDWREELEYALKARVETEDASRRPEQLDRFMKDARREHERAGPQTVSSDAEQRRLDWIRDRLVQYGRARAQTMGWPDNYTFTKALTERAVEEMIGEAGLPLTVVRPSIVESALQIPYPGWIEGFKMADPIILAFGRGSLPEFPGIPEGILDVIPVDLVVAAMLAVAATPPKPDNHRYFHVSSGDRNPLFFRDMYTIGREYFEANPLPGEDGRGSAKLPEWAFPGVLKVERMLKTGEKLVDIADKAVKFLPRNEQVRKLATRIDKDRARVEFMRRYSDLYGAYTEAEVIYTDDRTIALYESLSKKDRETFGFDCSVIKWPYYLGDVHMTAITATLRKKKKQHTSPSVKISPSKEGGDTVVAAFDMEGTILASNVVETYMWIRLHDMAAEDWPPELISMARNVPKWLKQDQRDRGEFLRTFYRRYEGARVDEVDRLVRDYAADIMLERCSSMALRRVREHRRAGHRTVLITAALELFTRPLAPLFDDIVAAELHEEDGVYSGFMATPPLVGEARAAWLRREASTKGWDLKKSYAYADSHSDLPMLRAVGNPVVVNPDVALYRLGKRRRWPIEQWDIASAGGRVLIPEPSGWGRQFIGARFEDARRVLNGGGSAR